MKNLKIPFPYSLYTLILLFYLLVLNQIFLDSFFLTFLIILISSVSFYSLFAPDKGAGKITDRAAPSADLMRENDLIKGHLLKIKTSFDGLWEKTSKVSLGTDAQVFSLEETMTSIEGISESIKKTVLMVERLSPSANSASMSVNNVIESTAEISAHNQELLVTLEKAITDIKNMSASVNTINNNFENLSVSSQDSGKKIKEIASFAKNIETSALESYKVSEDVAKQAAHGVASVKKTIDSMKNLKNIVTESSSVIKTLGDRSGEIGDVVKFIDSVTIRINLLALNASIIASQAGEHGKPFAVVASEMEKLASQTSNSTIEISQLTEAIQEMVQTTVQANEVGMWGVEEGVALASKAGDILAKIQERSSASVRMSKDSLSATGKQVKMAEDVLSLMTEEAKNLDIAGMSIAEHVKINRAVNKSANVMIGLTEDVKIAIDRQQTSSKDISEVINDVVLMVDDLAGLTKEQSHDSEQIKQATEIIKFISSENINAIKELAVLVEGMKNELNEDSLSFLEDDSRG